MTARDERPCVLVIAGSDSSGGAGIAADIRAGHALGAMVRLAVTAVTGQTDASVGTVHPVPPDLVHEQIAMALRDGTVGAVKIGMVGSARAVDAVASALAEFADTRPIVLDPVIASTSGTRLLDDAGLSRLLERLLPVATLVTPNRPELDLIAERLGGVPRQSISEGAAVLLRAGAGAVLVKGGHGEGAFAEDVLFEADGNAPTRLAGPRLPLRLRGTGCRLATAIAIRLAEGLDLATACRRAKAYLADVLATEGEAVAVPPVMSARLRVSRTGGRRRGRRGGSRRA